MNTYLLIYRNNKNSYKYSSKDVNFLIHLATKPYEHWSSGRSRSVIASHIAYKQSGMFLVFLFSFLLRISLEFLVYYHHHKWNSPNWAIGSLGIPLHTLYFWLPSTNIWFLNIWYLATPLFFICYSVFQLFFFSA